MAGHGVVFGGYVFEEFGGGLFAGVPEAVVCHVVIINELSFQDRREIGKCCASVCELSCATCIRWWEFMCTKQRVSSAAWIEG